MSIKKITFETGEELREPVEVGPYRAVETELVDEQGNTRRVRGHLVVRGVGRQVRRQLIEYGVRDMFAGAPEEVKPVLRFLDDVYTVDKYRSYHLVGAVEAAAQELAGKVYDENILMERPDAVNLFVAGLLRARFHGFPVGIGYGSGLRAGDWVPKTTVVLFVVDKFDNLVATCYNFEAHRKFGITAYHCWLEIGIYPVWPKVVVV